MRPVDRFLPLHEAESLYLVPVRNFFFAIFSLVLLGGCESDPFADPDYFNNPSLEAYIARHADFPVSNNLVACAAGGRAFSRWIDDPDLPISIFYLPNKASFQFRYFETDSLIDNPDSLAAYKEKDLGDFQVWNGFLRRFKRERIDHDKWCRVSYLLRDSLHLSPPIRLRYANRPTVVQNGVVEIDLEEPTRPHFSWQGDTVKNTDIYFQVVSDHFNDLLTGTYTLEKQFQFYDLNNVVFNINDIWRLPSLVAGQRYRFTLMAVDEQAWVNLVAAREFVTEAP